VLVGPHDSPSPREVPRSTQVGVPVLQDSRPLWHGLAGLQAPPSLHAAHAPALQTIFVPPGEEQDVPAGLFPLSIQTDDPVAQDVVPTLQALVASHAWPAEQETHIPARHTLLSPHTVAVPSGKGMLVSMHTALPVSQARTPLWHGFAGGQAEPATQGMQVPSMHTLPVPHDVPLGLFPDTRQVETPVEQDVVPVLQGSLTEHALTVQATQAPALHTWSTPQGVPFARGSPVSEQLMDAPQTSLPPWQALSGGHDSPSLHETHAPPLQILPDPQDVPFGAFPASRHTGSPVLQAVEPVRQGLSGMSQADPGTQATHDAVPLQTRSLPQALPAGRFIPVSTHWTLPPLQVRAPLWHGLSARQGSPSTQAVHAPP